MIEQSTQELIRELIFKLAPSLILSGVHSYVCTKDNGNGTLDLSPKIGVLHGPHLRVEQWAAPGVEAGLSVGDKLAIVFLDNDKGQPAIIAHMPLRQGKPASLKIDATGTITIGQTATTINIGGSSAVALAKSAQVVTWATAINTWAALVSTALSLTPPVALVSPATTKAKGV